MFASPRLVRAGGEVTVTATARALCTSPDARVHVALVLDATRSMEGAPMEAQREAARTFVDGLDLDANARTRVGIVQYDDAATVVCEPTNDRAAIESCIDRLAVRDVAGGSAIAEGIATGRNALLRARADAGASPPDVHEAMVVLADGSDNAGCGAVEAAAEAARSQGIAIAGVCLGPGCDETCMRSGVATSGHYFRATVPPALPPLFAQLADVLTRPAAAGEAPDELALVIRPAPGMRIVDGSQTPGAPFLEADGRTWRFPDPPREGVTVTFRALPLVAGDLPVLESAAGAYHVRGEELFAFAFDVPRVVVASDGALATATPGALGIAEHVLALAPERPEPGEVARLTYRLAFDDPVQPLGSHVALVADASGSMAGEANAALKASLRRLVDRLPLGIDPEVRVGVVSFNSSASILGRLSVFPEEVHRAIGTIGASGGTCIACGILAGRRILELERPAPGVEDLVVFTDGANNGGCGPVIDAAAAAKAEGVVVHAVCLLPGCDAQCMAAAASPGHYHEVSRADALGDAFEAVGEVLTADRRLSALDLTLHLPPHLRLVPGSAVPSPSDAGDPRAVRWRLHAVPPTGLGLSAAIEVAAAGSGAALMEAEATLRDGTTRRAVVEAVVGEAFEPPTAAPEPTATARPDPTTPGPRAIVFLPAASR